MHAQRKNAFRTVDAADFLLPEPVRRKRLERNAAPVDIEDAVFEVINTRPSSHGRLNDNPPRRRPASSELLPLTTRIAVGAIAIVERQLLKLSAPAFSTLLVSAFFLVFWACGGFGALSSARMAPTNAASFLVSETSLATEDANGMKILSVTGILTNRSSATRMPPTLRVASADGRMEFGRITLRSGEIGPSAAIRFSGRFKLSGEKSGDIAVIPVLD